MATSLDVRWHDDAVCVGADPDTFFPERGMPSRHAKALCRRCPVRIDCLEHAIRDGELFGIWGGESERVRRRIRYRLAARHRAAWRDATRDDILSAARAEGVRT